MPMTQKKREAAIKRIADIKLKISEYNNEIQELQDSLEADDKERLMNAAKKTGKPLDDVIDMLVKETEDKNEKTTV